MRRLGLLLLLVCGLSGGVNAQIPPLSLDHCPAEALPLMPWLRVLTPVDREADLDTVRALPESAWQPVE